MVTEYFVGDARPKAGRPHKHKEGYYKEIKTKRVLEETFQEWRKLKTDKDLPDDDTVA